MGRRLSYMQQIVLLRARLLRSLECYIATYHQAVVTKDELRSSPDV